MYCRLTKKVLDTLEIKKDREENKEKKERKVGILIYNSATNEGFLATEKNNNLQITYDSENNLVRLIVTDHPILTRYTNYDVYLLAKDTYNKYQAYLKSGGHSKSFEKFVEKVSKDEKHSLQFSFETGSDIGEPTKWDVKANTTDKILTTETLTVTAVATDDYGNIAQYGKLIFAGATDVNGQPVESIAVNPTEANLENGITQVTVTSDRTQQVILNFKTAGNYPEDEKEFSINAYFVKPAPEGSRVDIKIKKNSDNSYIIDGKVTLNNEPVVQVGVPLTAQNAVLSDKLPVTDEKGEFTINAVKEDSNKVAVVSMDSYRIKNVDMPIVGIDPVIFGNQPWTDTGIIVTNANTLIRVEATGTWADNLYAKVGENGIPVKVGASGGFVTGIADKLYLGAYNNTYADNVDAIIYLDDPKALGIYPTMSLTVNPNKLQADGKSQATVTGQVVYGQYPLVGGQVFLSVDLGSLDNTIVTTNDKGIYSTVLTAPTTAGTGTITAKFDNLEQKVTVTYENDAISQIINISQTNQYINTNIYVEPGNIVILNKVSPTTISVSGYLKLTNGTSYYTKYFYNSLSIVTTTSGYLSILAYAPATFEIKVIKDAKPNLDVTVDKDTISVVPSGFSPVNGISSTYVRANLYFVDNDGNKYSNFFPTNYTIRFNSSDGKTLNSTFNPASMLIYSNSVGVLTVTVSVPSLPDLAPKSVNINVTSAPQITNIEKTANGVRVSLDNGKTWMNIYLAKEFNGFVYDPVHKVYVGIGNDYAYGNYGTYWFGYTYKSPDGIHWKRMLTTGSYNLYGIATDGKGTIVVGGGWYGPYGIDTRIYTSNNGGDSFVLTASGYRSRMSYLPYMTGLYLGIVKSVTYNNGQFVAVGTYASATSPDGYIWHGCYYSGGYICSYR